MLSRQPNRPRCLEQDTITYIQQIERLLKDNQGGKNAVVLIEGAITSLCSLLKNSMSLNIEKTSAIYDYLAENYHHIASALGNKKQFQARLNLFFEKLPQTQEDLKRLDLPYNITDNEWLMQQAANVIESISFRLPKLVIYQSNSHDRTEAEKKENEYGDAKYDYIVKTTWQFLKKMIMRYREVLSSESSNTSHQKSLKFLFLAITVNSFLDDNKKSTLVDLICQNMIFFSLEKKILSMNQTRIPDGLYVYGLQHYLYMLQDSDSLEDNIARYPEFIQHDIRECDQALKDTVQVLKRTAASQSGAALERKHKSGENIRGTVNNRHRQFAPPRSQARQSEAPASSDEKRNIEQPKPRYS